MTEHGAGPETTLDLRGLRCPLPVLRVRKALLAAAPGTIVVALSDDPLAAIDIPHFVHATGDLLLETERLERCWRFAIRREAVGDAALGRKPA